MKHRVPDFVVNHGIRVFEVECPQLAFEKVDYGWRVFPNFGYMAPGVLEIFISKTSGEPFELASSVYEGCPPPMQYLVELGANSTEKRVAMLISRYVEPNATKIYLMVKKSTTIGPFMMSDPLGLFCEAIEMDMPLSLIMCNKLGGYIYEKNADVSSLEKQAKNMEDTLFDQ